MFLPDINKFYIMIRQVSVWYNFYAHMYFILFFTGHTFFTIF